MTTKLTKSLTLGILSALSVTPLLFAGLPASAQTSASQPASQFALPTSSDLSRYTPETAPVLRIGSRGTIVREVQVFLKQQGCLRAQPNGIFGTQTRAAVMQFQRSKRLTPDGVVGPGTWALIIRSQQT